MRVLKDSCKRLLELPKLVSKAPCQVEYVSLPSHCKHQEGIAAIRSASNSPSDCSPTSDLNKCTFFKILGKSKCKSNSHRSFGRIKWNAGPSKGSKRNFYQKTPQEKSKPLPRLLYIQNPIVWVSNKLDFRFLRINWDPLFNEAEFTRGARQAISTVTQLVSLNKFDNIKPLLTKNALINLRRDVEITWADEVKRNIGLAPEDVQLIIPRKLHFRQNAEPKMLESGFSTTTTTLLPTNKLKSDKKLCDIDVLFIALKYLDTHRFHQTHLCFVDIVARFHRNYSAGIPPDWTISAFKVRRFNVLPQKAE